MIDKDLIFLYGEDIRTSIKKIAEILNKSSQRIKYSISSLEKKGIVHNPYLIIDYAHFGFLLFRTYFSGAYLSEKERSMIIEQMTKNNRVIALYELDGEYDLVIEILAKNPTRFNSIINKLSKVNKKLKYQKTVLNMNSHLFPRYYLSKDINSVIKNEIIIGGDKKPFKPTDDEAKFLETLADNPKAKISSISKITGLSKRACRIIFNKLTKLEIICGVKALVNTQLLGIQRSRLFLKLRAVSPEEEKKMIRYFRTKKEVIHVHRTVGDWNLELDVEAKTKEIIRKMTIDMREKHGDIIEGFNIIDFHGYYYRRYIPKWIKKP